MAVDTRVDLEVQDIEQLVKRFYGQVSQDDILGPMFNTEAQVDWWEHIDKLTNFWSRTLFGIGEYQGNPLAAHQRIHARRAYTPEHFRRWLDLFAETVDARWAGPNADKVKRVATKIASLHSTKLLGEPLKREDDQSSLLIIETKHPAR